MPNPPVLTTLAPGDVHLWYTLTDDAHDPDHLARCRAVLSAAEQKRMDRFVREEDRDLFLVAHAMLREVLSRYADVAPAAWEFAVGEHGKPWLVGAPVPNLQFNLTHTRRLAACAVTRNQEIGVDAENTSRPISLAITRICLAPSENDDLAALPPERRLDVFWDYWTLKEAYIKARGLGFALPLTKIAFAWDAQGGPRIAFAPPVDDDPAAWRFFQHRPRPEYRMAVAVRRSPAGPMRLVVRRIEKLLE